jgi:tRNA dimethylallyltransferase
MRQQPLVAVVGATATGKSDAAVAIAEALNGQVVGADAYQLYRGLDIGTAKVDAATRARVPHHLIDVVGPDEPMSLALYLELAKTALSDIWSRGKLPILAGGSGQYVWALLEGWQVPRIEPDPELRHELEAVAAQQGPSALQARLALLDPAAAAHLDPDNSRRLIRAIELVSSTGLPLAACQTRTPIDADVFVLGLGLDREALYQRLDARTSAMYDAGFLDEVQGLRDAGYGETSPVRGGVGYKEASFHLDGAFDLDEAIRRHKNANHRLVRRQGAWFKAGDGRIHWLPAGPSAPAQSVEAVREWLASKDWVEMQKI